jgi:rhamnosyltransferase
MNPEVSIIVLMKNEERYVGETLRAIYAQKTGRPFEVIAIDSGSKDRTVAIARGFENLRLVQIRPEEFGHGKTRNFGAGLARGRFLVFNNADATPVDENWLEELLEPFSDDENVAGTYSTHRARPDCTPIKKRKIETNEVFVNRRNRSVNLRQLPEFNALPLYRRKDLYSFVTISCAMRKSIWKRYPFKEIKLGEDLDWGKTILDAGYTIVACYRSQVYHSHNFTLVNYFKANFDDSSLLTLIHLNHFFENKWRVLSFLFWEVRWDLEFIWRLNEDILYKLKWLCSAPLYSFAAAMGLFLGFYHKSLPSWLVQRISVVDKIRKS